jgi:HK97 family phage prohead protease
MPDGNIPNHSDCVEQPRQAETRAPSLVAPAFMASSARRGLTLHAQGQSGAGLRPQTVADARKMADGEALSEDKWRRIAPWIARHIGDLAAAEAGEITAGVVAMLLWGGGSSRATAQRAQRYAERIVDQLDNKRVDAPAPPSDQIKGSDQNEPQSAADGSGDITLSEATQKALQNKADEHNEAMTAAGRPSWTRVRVGALRAVYRRGAGAFSTSHRPNMTRAQWAMARVNAFLYLARTGRPENENYVGDNDLLHPDHPKRAEGASGGGDRRAATMRPMSKVIEARWCAIGDDERRVAYTTLDARELGDGSTLVGYAAVFDSPSEPLPFIEVVRKGAFADTLNKDVRLLIDHEGVPLARTTSGTLRLSEDDTGLLVEADLDRGNPDAQRLMSAVGRGDISQMSFAFKTLRDHWTADKRERELLAVDLFDVSVVTFPAYEQTSAELRSRANLATLPSTTSRLLRQRQLQVAKARTNRWSPR